jgi:uncharacterized protein YndB with AHSA1/START domain
MDMTNKTDDQTANITIVRTFEASREQVFAAWTTPASFADWFGGAQTKVPLDSVEMDVRPGGAWRATMKLDQGDINWNGEYREVDPPQRLVLTLADRPGPEFELVTVVLVARGSATEMTFTQSGGHMDAAGYEQAKQGWQTFFDSMAALVADEPTGV